MTEILILTILVKCLEPYSVQGKTTTVVMVPFTGTAEGRFFNGTILGQGCDTQHYVNGKGGLSARYMIEGVDIAGQKCRIFIDNSEQDENGFHPKIVTDSKALADWENLPLRADVLPAEGGVTVKIYKPAQ